MYYNSKVKIQNFCFNVYHVEIFLYLCLFVCLNTLLLLLVLSCFIYLFIYFLLKIPGESVKGSKGDAYSVIHVVSAYRIFHI